MKVVITAHGSRGDVYPMVAVAQMFVNNGHTVTMLTQNTFHDELKSRNIKGVYLFSDITKEMQTLNENAASVSKSITWAQKSLKDEFEHLKILGKDADLLICTNNEFSVSSIAEAYNIPAFRVAYIPSIPGKNVPPIIPWQNIPEFLSPSAWWLINKGLDFLALKTANKQRQSLGLKPIKSLSKHFMDTYINLFGFNKTLAPPHSSWPENSHTYCGYPFETQSDDIPKNIKDFLNKGPSPIYLGFGSVTVKNPQKFTKMVLDAAKMANVRLVLSEGWTGLGQDEMPSYAIKAPQLSHDNLFKNMAAICHHGGAGTTHRAAKAGVPQLIMPIIVDQFFWGDRISKLNLGPKPVTPGKLTSKKLANLFIEITTNINYSNNAKRVAKKINSENGAEEIFNIITKKMRQAAA
ncbi:MAG: glycosyltransferase family 1 protein [Deltaproteobacteria bacterium]|nr:glycosyltransferase family 1 protein [Deltaproteobacteria bacterium]